MISAGQPLNQQPVTFYSPAELAELFGVTERTVMEWRRENGWPSVRVGRTIRFTQRQVDEIVARHSQAPKPGSDDSGQVTAIPGQSRASAARQQRAS